MLLKNKSFKFRHGEVPKRLKGHPWKGCRSLIAARGFKSLLLRFGISKDYRTVPWQINSNATLKIPRVIDVDNNSGRIQRDARIVSRTSDQKDHNPKNSKFWRRKLREQKPVETGEEKTFNMRVWSWLRMNAGGVPNTCKSNGQRWNLVILC